MGLSQSQKRIAAMLRAKGRKVTVIDETRDPAAVAEEVRRAAQQEVYCHGCSVAGGADRAIYHLPPACSEEAP